MNETDKVSNSTHVLIWRIWYFIFTFNLNLPPLYKFIFCKLHGAICLYLKKSVLSVLARTKGWAKVNILVFMGKIHWKQLQHNKLLTFHRNSKEKIIVTRCSLNFHSTKSYENQGMWKEYITFCLCEELHQLQYFKRYAVLTVQFSLSVDNQILSHFFYICVKDETAEPCNLLKLGELVC